MVVQVRLSFYCILAIGMVVPQAIEQLTWNQEEYIWPERTSSLTGV